MLTRRTVTSLVLGALVAAACGSPTGLASSTVGATPGAATATALPPLASTAPTPDIGALRVPTAGWKTDFTIASVDLSLFQGGGPPKDGITPVDAPRYESIEAALEWMAPKSPVISLVIGGSARAYPLAILIWHEIANDTLGGVPVLVTFCPLCNTALVFERTLDGTVLDFGTSGNLIYSNLVMYDRQTESWWPQVTGEAVVGTLTGQKLTFLASQIVSLADFAAAHPDGDVLSRDTGHPRDYGRNPYPGYDVANDRPFLFEGSLDLRLAPKSRVVTIDLGDRTVAIPYVAMEGFGAIEVTGDIGPVVAFWAPGTASPLDAPATDAGRDAGGTGVFTPIVDGQRLTFSRKGGRDGPITDAETGSTWSVTGRATAGPLVGSRLDPVVHGDHFWFSWVVFRPDTEIWSGE